MMRLRRSVRPSMAAASISAVSRQAQMGRVGEWANGRMGDTAIRRNGEMGPRTRWGENLGAGKRIPLRWADRSPASPNPAGWYIHGAAQNRRGTVLAVSHILGAPSFSPHRSRAFIRPLARSEHWPAVQAALFCLCHGRPTWNLSSPIFGEVVEDDGTALRWIRFYYAARLGTGRYYETT